MSSIFFADVDNDDDEDGHRLHDIRAEEVSIVDRAANRRRFLLLKRSDDMSDPRGAQVIEDQDGNLVTSKDEEARKVEMKIPAPVKEAVERSATEALNRLQSFVNMVKEAAPTDEDMKMPLPEKLGKELQAISGLLGGIGEKYPSPTAKDEDGITEDKEVEKSEDAAANKILAAIEDLKKLLTKTETEKSEEKAETEPQKAVDLEPVAKAFEKLADAVGAQAKQIAEIRKSAGGSRAVAVEGEDTQPATHHWPYDLAREVRKAE